MAQQNGKNDTSIDSSMRISRYNNFWNVLENYTEVKIPLHVKKILSLNNFDNVLSFRHITKTTIDELEKFTREKMNIVLHADDDPRDFYGRYYKSPEQFRFMIGDRHLISELVDIVKRKYEIFRNQGINEHVTGFGKNQLGTMVASGQKYIILRRPAADETTTVANNPTSSQKPNQIELKPTIASAKASRVAKDSSSFSPFVIGVSSTALETNKELRSGNNLYREEKKERACKKLKLSVPKIL